MHKRIIPLLFVWLFGTAGLLSGQVKYSNDFLSIGVGARIMAMGGAGVAWIDDVTAAYWNPANLLNNENRMDFGLMHAEYFAGLAKYDYGAASYRLDDQSVVALSAIRLGVDDIPNTLELIDADGNIRYDRIQTFSASDLGVLLSYARTTGIPGLNAGVNFKVIYRRTGAFAHSWGFGLDAAVSWIHGLWQVGAVLRDATGTFNAWSFNHDLLDDVFKMTGNELPASSLEVTVPKLILGGSRLFQIQKKLNLRLAADMHVTFDGRRHGLLPAGPVNFDPFIGAELIYARWLFIRAGVGNMQRIPGFDGNQSLVIQPDLGLGVKYRNFFIDYALTNVGQIGGVQYSNLLSLHMTVQ
ncbi:MAG: PorV/PorQ family protein [Bacteroidales bacterium]|nr:PorV/PorQ family protein [Bacteroidales bacterium]